MKSGQEIKINLHVVNPDALAMATFSEGFCDANHELGAKVVAGLAGVNVRTLSNYGSDHGGGTHTLDAVLKGVCAQALLGDPRVLDAMAAACGRAMYVVPRVNGRVTQDVMREIASESTALAVQVGAIADAFADGSISTEELALVRSRTRDLIATAVQVLSLVEAHARDAEDDGDTKARTVDVRGRKEGRARE